jgi:hypothetical protein
MAGNVFGDGKPDSLEFLHVQNDSFELCHAAPAIDGLWGRDE